MSVGALAWFELRRGADRSATLVALLLFTGALAIGHWDHWRGNGATGGGSFFGYAYALGAIVLMRFGLAEDRRLRFDEYLIANQVRMVEYLAAKVLAMAALVGGYGVMTAIMETAFSLGRPADAIWLAAAFTLAAWLFAPVAMLVEAGLDTALPGAVVLLVWLVAVFVAYISAGSTLLVDVLSLRELAPGYWPSLAPLALRVLVGAPAGFIVAGAIARLNLPRC